MGDKIVFFGEDLKFSALFAVIYWGIPPVMFPVQCPSVMVMIIKRIPHFLMIAGK